MYRLFLGKIPPVSHKNGLRRKNKKKKKKILVKKLNSHNIKIKDVINKNFIQKGIKDIYEHVRRNKDNILFFEEFTELLNLIKVVFDVENVYIGKIYKWKKKKKNKNILQFVYTNENCDLKGKNIILKEKEFNHVFTKFFPNEEENFLFEKNYLFPNIVKEDFIYDEINENLFLNVNPFLNNKNCLSRLQKSLYTPPWGYNKEDNNLMGHSHQGNNTKKQSDFNSNSLETSTTEDTSDGDEARSKGEYSETGDDNSDSSENSDGEYGNISAADGNTQVADGNTHVADCNIAAAYRDDELDGDEGDCFKGYLLDALHMNLTYKCVYIYEVMEREVSFFHPYMKPGDFLFIPIIYNTCYNFNLLNKLYLRKRKLLLHTFDEEIEHNGRARNTNEEEINSLSSPKDTDAHECNKEETQREKSTLERPCAFILFFDHPNDHVREEVCRRAGRTGKCGGPLRTQARIHILGTLLQLCTCLSRIICTHFCTAECDAFPQVNYLLDCECGEEKQSIEKLRTKMEEANYERVINKFKSSLSHHPYYDKSDELTKHMTMLLWVEKKILKHQHKIVEIGKVKVECNRHFSRTLLSCLVMLDYDHTRFSLSSDLLQDYDWGRLIACANGQFIDKLTSFNALTAFAGLLERARRATPLPHAHAQVGGGGGG
ncbi:conserved Plasmodium protein, unknown function [Plasmodium ovale wallikeri]|uniref:Uncharacterized protein n=1 Tax=Plasmodium ovale wallikeri TaxID=864142 RepID=A0A1A8YZG4_PLAOA|nr:conserved Plasmodium protein, unknown function [Plasmodium ovale wallikeri]